MYTTRTVHIQNLITRCRELQRQIRLLCQEGFSNHAIETQQDPPPGKRILANIQKSALWVTRHLEEEQAHAAHLPVRSRRAYQWLLFLSQRKRFQQHIITVNRLYRHAEYLSQSRDLSDFSPEISLYFIGPLYRFRLRKRGWELTLHESFLIAPPRVLRAALDAGLGDEPDAAKPILRNFTRSAAYAEVREELEYLAVPRLATIEGDHKNLYQAFRRVNRKYFNSALPAPHLVWSERLTCRKFGHYRPETDTILISRSLDDPQVSDHTLDYVMFHELLHKKLGSKVLNGRRHSHTPRFRDLESRYGGLQAAKSALQALAEKHA